MNISYTKKFLKQYQKLIPSTQEKFQNKIDLFIKDSRNPSLRDHGLKGALAQMRAFSVAGDIRVVYQYLKKDHIKLLNIGTHNQVY